MTPRHRTRCLAASACALATLASAQMPDMAAVQKWSNVKVVRYDVSGEIALKGQQIPPADADLYADVTERVRLSIEWDVRKQAIIGKPVITNEPATLANLASIDKGEKGGRRCPTGKVNGPYEHFDVVEVRQARPGGPIELVGKRIHPDTEVSEACSSKLRPYKGATREVKEYIALPDPSILAFGAMMKGSGPKVSPDGRSIVLAAQNSKWVWTLTPTPR